jgi:hypothetical protein
MRPESTKSLVRAWNDRTRRAALGPVDPAGLVAFRVLFGLLAAFGAARFLWLGWVERSFVRPTYFFHYWGFGWVEPLSATGMRALFAVMIVCGVLIALGALYRVASATFFLVFTYVELIDVTNYLNHYYLLSLLALLVTALPLHRAHSVDAWLRPGLALGRFPAWWSWVLRGQVATVYFYAAIAKATGDWLLHGQPLGIWLASRGDLPLIGPVLAAPWLPLAMSWGGFLYDLTIWSWLLVPRTRPVAYLAVLGFHGAVGALFPIGMFPWIMVVATTVFFAPEWPRRLLSFFGRPSEPPAIGAVPPRFGPLAALLALHLAVQVLVPLRAFAYGGNVLWHEQGMRWSWRVMAREKNGSVTFRVRARGWSRERLVSPSDYLTPIQEREMVTQPDLILQLAHHIRDELEARGLHDVEVRADARASLNGRAMARFVDPDADLARIEDSLLPASWILPAPGGPPPHLSPRTVTVGAR